MKRYAHGIVVGAALFFSVAANAAEPTSAALTLSALLAEIDSNSLTLSSKRDEARAAAERPAQARAFEDPTLMVELWQVPVTFSQVPLMLTLRQPIPWPGKLRARAAVVKHEHDSAMVESEDTARTLRLQAARAYHAYRLAVRSEAVLQETQRLLSLVVASVNARYRVGRAELAELLKAQEAQISTENTGLDVARERELSITAINTLLSRPPTSPLGLPSSEPPLRPLPDENSLIARALSNRPELRIAQTRIAQDEAKARAARLERAPDLAAWASFMAMTRGSNEHTFTVGVQTSLPTFSLSRHAAAEREALAQVAAQKTHLRQLEIEIAAEVRAACLHLETASRHVRLHLDSLIPLSEKAVRAAQAGYQSGRVELALLIDATRALTMHHLDHERYSAELGQRQAELEAAIGGPLWPSNATAGGQP